MALRNLKGAIKKKSTEGNEVIPSILKQFEGNATNSNPADNDIAVGNDGTIISVVNSNIAIYNSAGTLVQTKSLASFASSLALSDLPLIHEFYMMLIKTDLYFFFLQEF